MNAPRFSVSLGATGPAAADKPQPQGARLDEPRPVTDKGESGVDLLPLLRNALPTRSRPQGQIDGPGMWLVFKFVFATAMEETRRRASNQFLRSDFLAPMREALEWFAGNPLQCEPGRLNAADALALAKQTIVVMREDRSMNGLEPFMNWLVTRVAPQTFVEVALLPLELARCEYLKNKTTILAQAIRSMRSALVKTPDAYYESVLALCQKACAAGERGDDPWRVHFAFLLADDRRQAHQLQPLAVIEASEGCGSMARVQGSSLIPLVLEAPPESVQRLRARLKYKDCHFLYTPQNDAQAVESAVAAALHFGQSPVPAIQWALRSNIKQFAPLLLSLEGEEAFSLLLPHLQDIEVQEYLEKAATERPSQIFPKMLGAVMAGSKDAFLLARVRDAIRRHPRTALAQWVGGQARALRAIDRALPAGVQSLAAMADCPPVLRHPPWLGRSSAREPPAVRLEPIPTPFAFSPGQERSGPAQNEEKIYCPPIEDVIEAVVHFAAHDTPFSPAQIEPGIKPRKAHKFFRKLGQSVRTLKGNPEMFASVFDPSPSREGAVTFLLLKDSPGAFISEDFRQILFRAVMAHLGQGAAPAIIKLLTRGSEDGLDLIECIDCPAIAPIMAQRLLNTNTAVERAMAWLAKFRRTAVQRLLPDALGEGGRESEAAIYALRAMATKLEGAREEIETVARLYAQVDNRALQALERVLDPDPLAWYPPNMAKLPSWFDPSMLSRPELISGGAALPDKALANLVQMIAFSDPQVPYAGIELVRQAATQKSLDAFSWDLFYCWLNYGARDEENWAMRALAWFGGDESAHKLARLMRNWFGQSVLPRVADGLDVLCDMGSEIALMLLASLAERLNFEGYAMAREKMAQMAQKRALTREELADRLMPKLGLDESGALAFDFASRRLCVGFDDNLQPWVKDEAGARLKDLPRAKEGDDAQWVLQTHERWRALKRDVRVMAGLLLRRLENMLVNQRRISPETFLTCFARHPLARHFTARLVWGIYPDEDPSCPPATTFRLTEALTLADVDEERVELVSGAGSRNSIGLVHPMNPPERGLRAWSALFAEYEIAQPFAQLARERFELTEKETAARAITRFEDIEIDAARMMGIAAYGWRLESSFVSRAVQVEGKPLFAMLEFLEGDLIHWRLEEGLTAGTLYLDHPDWENKSAIPAFGALDKVTSSEILRALTLVIAKARK